MTAPLPETLAPLSRRRIAAPRHPLVWIGGILVLLQVGAALLAPWIAPDDPLAQHVIQRMKGPGAVAWLGTDQFGRDVLSRILYGYRASLAAAASAVLLALLVGGGLGVAAALRGGLVDRIGMRLMDILFAFPIILLAIGIVAVLGPGATTTALAIGIVYVPVFARLLRGPALVIVSSQYVLGARAIGAGEVRILRRHVLPNLASVILVQASLALSTAILVEASLSFLGLGTQPPTPSLGRMLAEARSYLLLSPWDSIFSGLAILLASFGFNLLGDGLRDALDPRLRGSE
ncbi:peptide/nickel transport system permease protein [Inquilinus ginsengisoli]|uniref:Peptide/nickel transport system permease protein n=1 Tax=Inquilinus ginsengisoli TaxID=363840 RepID=A0ABU1JV36_9PROT|nr:ABC transporter permease [Inquilinus ginsengisoli]MDR6292483.1 peptide/nickel transport system permease protein [Inquilinus ginsengisoli]